MIKIWYFILEMKGSIDKGMKTNNFRNKFLQSFTNKT